MSLLHKNKYNPGLHKLLTLQVQDQKLLTSVETFLSFSEQVIDSFELEIVGISSHRFDLGGYTVAICLKESHICIHTWPEFNQLTLDIYLCNYLSDNTEKVEKIGDSYKSFFNAHVLNETNVLR